VAASCGLTKTATLTMLLGRRAQQPHAVRAVHVLEDRLVVVPVGEGRGIITCREGHSHLKGNGAEAYVIAHSELLCWWYVLLWPSWLMSCSGAASTAASSA